jgi:thioredoxin 1
MVLEVTDKNIAEILSEKEVTVLQFSADWCGPCKMLGPIIDELANDNKDSSKINIGKVNVDDNNDTAVKYGIRGIPTVLFIKDGNVVDRMTGLKSKIEIQEKIDSLLS